MMNGLGRQILKRPVDSAQVEESYRFGVLPGCLL
jgi:hypothetical protein